MNKLTLQDLFADQARAAVVLNRQGLKDLARKTLERAVLTRGDAAEEVVVTLCRELKLATQSA